jgi:hypothetical protein
VPPPSTFSHASPSPHPDCGSVVQGGGVLLSLLDPQAGTTKGSDASANAMTKAEGLRM